MQTTLKKMRSMMRVIRTRWSLAKISRTWKRQSAEREAELQLEVRLVEEVDQAHQVLWAVLALVGNHVDDLRDDRRLVAVAVSVVRERLVEGRLENPVQ